MESEGSNRSGDAVVDVGIPTRLRASGPPRYLAESVESVLAQTFARWRLTISENAAAGDAAIADVLRPYLRDPRVRHVVTARDDWSGARNSTFLLTTGSAPYVAILHDDDVWDPEWLERRVAFLERHPECAYVFAGNRRIDGDGREIGRSRPPYASGVHRPEEVVPLLLDRVGMPMPPAPLVRRSAYEAVGPAFDERFPAWDYDMTIRLAARFPIGYLDGWDSGFRVHDLQQTYGERWGERKILLEDVLDEILGATAPHLRLDERARRRRKADAHLSAALDAVETGRRRDAVRLLAGALRLHAAALVNPRLPAVLLTLLLGRHARAWLTRARAAVRRRGYLHRRGAEVGRP